MGCNFQIVLHSWALRPCATNLKFTDSTERTIMALYSSLQNSLINSLFAINWFDIGMTIGNLIEMQLPVCVLKLLNVTCTILVQNHSHEYSSTWQNFFNWILLEWTQLGYNSTEYRQSVLLPSIHSCKKRPVPAMGSAGQ